MIQDNLAVVDDASCRFNWPRLVAERWEVLKNRMADELSGGLLLSRFAAEAGVSVAYLNSWLESRPSMYNFSRSMDEKNPDLLLAEALETSFAALDQERLRSKRNPGRVETSVTRAVMDGIASARDLVETVLIDAPPGLGKTEGFREYIARVRKTEGFDCPVWLIELDEYSLSHKAILGQIARQCVPGGRFDGANEYALFSAIIEATEGKGGVLIVDEGNHLGDASRLVGIPIINGLRRFPDRGFFGIALLNNGEIYRCLSAGKYAQLFSRMSAWRVDIASLGNGKNGQPALTEEDVYAVMAAWGVSGVAERRYCIKAASQPGALRTLVTVFRQSIERFDCIDAATLNQIRRF
jgi:DNA transposition AAA+ family ATPase